MPEPRKLRVFLCHASQDKPVVRELYQRLLAEGWIDPWLDEEKLLPGQDWDFEIEKAVESADVVIVCISSNSVSKEGYVQREFRFVLDIALEKPEGTIFIVPLRLNQCQPPRRLKSWHYTDYFPLEQKDRSFERLKKSFQLKLQEIIRRESEFAEQKGHDNNVILGEKAETNVYSEKSTNEEVVADVSDVWAFFMPFSIGLETANGVFTPVVSRGDKLPIERKEVFSTAADNQKKVEIHVLLGENKTARNNLSLGRFSFENIPPAPRGVPQIEFQFNITQQLELRFVVVDLTSGRIKNYKPINLKGLTPPSAVDPFSGVSEKEDGSAFSKFFDTIFKRDLTKDKTSQDYQQNISLSFDEAVSGTTRKLQVEHKEYLVRIPAGVNTGTKVRIAGVMQNPKGSKGDLYLLVTVQPHAFFERKDLDLHMKYPVSSELALLGGELPVPDLVAKSKFKLIIPPGTQDKQIFRLTGKGIQNVKDSSKVGDFYLMVEVYDHRNLSREHKKILDEINKYVN